MSKKFFLKEKKILVYKLRLFKKNIIWIWIK